MNLKDHRVIVTGAAGFLGSHLIDRLLEMGAFVIGIDNFLTGDRRNISRLRDHSNFQFLLKDVSTANMIFEKPIHYVLHFASPASPIDYLEFPIETLEVGSNGTRNMLKIAELAGARFLLASTSEVYGDPLVHPQKESYWGNVNPVGPRGVYDEAKRYAEAITMAYHRYHKVDVAIARIFNTYGPRMRSNDGRAIPAFIDAALRNNPIPMFGDGKQTRSFGYVDDTVSGLLALLLSNQTGPINIGTPVEYTLLVLAEAIIDICNSKSEIVFKPLPEDDPKQRCPDINEAFRTLNWRPQFDLCTGLVRTINYFKTLHLPLEVPS